jgi:predicted nuclease of predicted toxin-antitoxin system
MKVLLDECVPRKLMRELEDHEVFTVTERGWSGIKNGNLLALAAPEFNVFLTVDQNLKYQQNLKNFSIAIILLTARNNRLKTLLPLMPEVREALSKIAKGDLVHIGTS